MKTLLLKNICECIFDRKISHENIHDWTANPTNKWNLNNRLITKEKIKKKKIDQNISYFWGGRPELFFEKKKNIFKVCSGWGNMGYKNIMIEL